MDDMDIFEGELDQADFEYEMEYAEAQDGASAARYVSDATCDGCGVSAESSTLTMYGDLLVCPACLPQARELVQP